MLIKYEVMTYTVFCLFFLGYNIEVIDLKNKGETVVENMKEAERFQAGA